jgi:zinc protease
MSQPPKPHRFFKTLAAAGALAVGTLLSGCVAPQYSIVELGTPYSLTHAVVVSTQTLEDAAWREVAETLVAQRNAKLITYDAKAGVASARDALAAVMPRYTSFVVKPENCGRRFIAEVHRLTRKLDDDPWLDTQWGVITGVDAARALKLVRAADPLVVNRTLATTSLDYSLFSEFFLLCDDTPGGWLHKKPDDTVLRGRDDLGKPEAIAWADFFNSAPDLIVSSSHGDENGFELPYHRGAIRARKGALYALTDTSRSRPPRSAKPLPPSGNPKVFFPVGNGLVGHITGNGADSVATAMLGDYGVKQMVGYTVPTEFGRGGWDMLSLWQTLPGRNSFSEAFFFNQQQMLHDIAAISPDALAYAPRLGEGERTVEDHVAAMVAEKLKFDPRNLRRGGRRSPDWQLAGLLWDIDTVAFFGDPAWNATLANPKKIPGFLALGIVSRGDEHRLSVTVRDAARAAANTAPVGVIFSRRLRDVEILEGKEYEPVVADNFILLLKPRPQKGESELIVRFKGIPVE